MTGEKRKERKVGESRKIRRKKSLVPLIQYDGWREGWEKRIFN